MNTISRTGIEGFDYTWNPVRGCLTGCPYCWARGLTRRFAGNTVKAELNFNRDIACPTVSAEMLERLKNFKPTWLEYQFTKPFPKKSSRIVVGWQSDIAYWQPEWMDRVLGKIREYPQHTFFFLTKIPHAYNGYDFPGNCWLGLTVTNDEDYWTKHTTFREYQRGNHHFLSIEPLLGAVEMPSIIFPPYSWIIIGAQTGSGEKVIPKREWVEAMIKQAKELHVPVYLKDNLLKAVPGLPRLKEIPG